MSDAITLGERFKAIEDAIIELHKRSLFQERLSGITDTIVLSVLPRLQDVGIVNPAVIKVVHGQLQDLLSADLREADKVRLQGYLRSLEQSGGPLLHPDT